MRTSISTTSGVQRSASATASRPLAASPTISIRASIEDGGQAGAHQLVVVSDEDAGHAPTP